VLDKALIHELLSLVFLALVELGRAETLGNAAEERTTEIELGIELLPNLYQSFPQPGQLPQSHRLWTDFEGW
jgi:hypothetical protein